MKRLLLLVGLLALPSSASAQCNGIFPNNTVCGNITGAGNLPRPTNPTAFLGAAGGSNGQIQYNNAGALGGLTDPQVTARIQAFTSILSGAAPASGGGTTNFLRADGTWSPPTSPGGTGISPQARMTLVPGVAIMTGSVTAATTIYVTPSGGNIIPIYNGTTFVSTTFVEVSQTTTDTTKSPAAVTTNSNYDIFCWIDTGPTNRCTRGPAWTSNINRGTGAGTSELVLVNGLYLNAVAITNGPAAQRGTYMGSVRSNGTSTIDYILGGSGSGGVAGSLGVWNMYNRNWTTARTTDNGVAYGYTSATVRQARASAGNQVSVMIGLPVDSLSVKYQTNINTAAVSGAFGLIAIGEDSTTAAQLALGYARNSGAAATTYSPSVPIDQTPLIGFHTYAALEASDGINSASFDVNANASLALSVWN